MVKQAAKEVTRVGSDWEQNIVIADMAREELAAIRIQAAFRRHQTRKALANQ